MLACGVAKVGDYSPGPSLFNKSLGAWGHTDEWWADSLFVSHYFFERLMVPNLLVFRWWWWRGTAMLMVLNIRKHARADVEGLATRWRYKCSRVRARLNWASKSKVLPLIVHQLRLQQAHIGPILQHGSTPPPSLKNSYLFFYTYPGQTASRLLSHTVLLTHGKTHERSNQPPLLPPEGKGKINACTQDTTCLSPRRVTRMWIYHDVQWEKSKTLSILIRWLCWLMRWRA